MMVLVDTSVWSLALRRVTQSIGSIERELSALIANGQVAIIGAIRQELLSGIRHDAQFVRLRDRLREFPDLVLASGDYEQAAAFSNQCRTRGVQGSSTDFLICAAAMGRDLSIFSTDRDFPKYAEVLPIKLHAPHARPT